MTATPRHIAVIDIGKTNAKLAMVDLRDLAEIAVITRPNAVRPGPPWPHYDIEGHWQFLLAGLRDFHAAHGIDAVSVTAHGASAVLLDAGGGLAAPVLDYEHPGPDSVAAAYDAIRPDFASTGSPRLPMGLNVGAQLHWQLAQNHGLRDRLAQVVTYPGYWGFRLTGIASCDVTSLGCHTDLWVPDRRDFSALPAALGLAGRFAPPRQPGEVLGMLLPQVAAVTGLPRSTPVVAGIHDSNASLYPHLLARTAPFAVVSTGTWVITMAVGGDSVALDPARDTLINVNALGDPVRSARFMGGREHDLLMAGHGEGAAGLDTGTADRAADRATVLAGAMLLPAAEPSSGPFAGCRARWVGAEPAGRARAVAVGFYLALMTAECLKISGAQGEVIVEGPFARNRDYLEMLAAATGRPVVAARSATGTAIGAALLFATDGALPAGLAMPDAVTAAGHPALAAYAARWRAAVGAACRAAGP